MRRESTKPYLFLLVALLVAMSLPKQRAEGIRGMLFASLTPVWQQAQAAFVPSDDSEKEVLRLQAEIQLLHNQVEQWQELYRNEHELNIQMSGVVEKTSPELLKLQLDAVPAKVIFRSPSSWNSSFWVNVGAADNQTLGNGVVAKNSPVVVGSSVVGVLDYVGKNQSRVRLITDSGLAPSVRAVRGGINHQRLIDQITKLQDELKSFGLLQEELEAAKLAFESAPTRYLAKGELRGSSQPLWRSNRSTLHGIGFNYDFDDAYGAARDLRASTPETLIEEDDLLVTTGMDGVFPAGLSVGRVTEIHTLKEGDYYYELEAAPTAGNLNELTLVFILPPQGFNENDQAPYR